MWACTKVPIIVLPLKPPHLQIVSNRFAVSGANGARSFAGRRNRSGRAVLCGVIFPSTTLVTRERYLVVSIALFLPHRSVALMSCIHFLFFFFRDVREGIIRCILATDMARHNEILTQFQEATPEFDYTNKVHTNLVSNCVTGALYMLCLHNCFTPASCLPFTGTALHGSDQGGRHFERGATNGRGGTVGRPAAAGVFRAERRRKVRGSAGDTVHGPGQGVETGQPGTVHRAGAAAAVRSPRRAVARADGSDHHAGARRPRLLSVGSA